MILTSWNDWQRWADEYSVLPYVQSFPIQTTLPLSWLPAWARAASGSFVLESGKNGRYTFWGQAPVSTIRGTADRATVFDASGSTEQWQGKPLDLVKRWMAPFRAPSVERAPKWVGGCVGFWGYDVVRSIEQLPSRAQADLSVPDYAFARVNELWIVDHEERRIYCAVSQMRPDEHRGDEAWLKASYAQAAESAERMKREWDGIIAASGAEEITRDHARKLRLMEEDAQPFDVQELPDVVADFPKESYIAAVRRIQQYIGAGDVFQVNLSVRQHKALKASAEEIYEWLRLVNPSPYMGLLRFDDFQLVSGSPELLVQLERGRVRTRPIAGTRRRGIDEEEDRRLAEELLNHEKERAEHIMLVDLERNDLGRISEYGSVRVSEFMVIERYSHVMHIVSEVEGTLAEGCDAFDVIAASFPGGTITGAPKIRTMEIIEELEPVRRGPYTGAMGWIDYNGDMEFNIVIRTLVAAEGIGYVQAGAGIVVDSLPEREFTESMNKAKAMWKAIQYSERNHHTPGGN